MTRLSHVAQDIGELKRVFVTVGDVFTAKSCNAAYVFSSDLMHMYLYKYMYMRNGVTSVHVLILWETSRHENDIFRA